LFDPAYGYEDTLSLWMNARRGGPKIAFIISAARAA